MRDPVYEDEVPVEDEDEFDRIIASCVHVSELVRDSPYRELRVYRCVKCFESMYEAPEDEEEWWNR